MRPLLTRTTAAVAVVGLYAILGFTLLPSLAKARLERLASETLKRQLDITEVRFNPFLLRLEIDGLDFKEADGTPILAFRQLVTDFELSSLWRRAWTFSEIRLDSPRVRLHIDRGGSFNLVRLARDLDRDGAKKDPGLPRLLFQIAAIGQGEIDFSDVSGSAPVQFKLNPINIRFQDLSTLPERDSPYSIVASTADGESIRWKGKVSLHPVGSTGHLAFNRVRVRTLWEFARDRLNLVAPEGTLDLETSYRFAYSAQDTQFALDGLKAEMSGLRLALQDSAAPMLQIGTVTFSDGRFDLKQREAGLGSFTLQDARVRTEADPAGTVDWERIARPANTTGEDPPAAVSAASSAPWKFAVKSVDLGAVALEHFDRSRRIPIVGRIADLSLKLAASGELSPSGLKLKAQDIAATLGGTTVQLENSGQEMVRLERTDLAGGQLDLAGRILQIETVKFSQGRVDTWIDSAGELNWAQLSAARDPDTIGRGVATAQAGAQPWDIQLKHADLTGFRAGFSDRRLEKPERMLAQDLSLKLSDYSSLARTPVGFDLKLKVREGGELSVRGKADLTSPSVEARVKLSRLALTPFQPYLARLAKLQVESGTASADARMNYNRRKGVSRLSLGAGLRVDGLSIILESETRQPFLAWNSMQVPDIRFSLAPDRLDIAEVRFDAPAGKLIIFDDRSVNLKKILMEAPATDVPVPAQTGAAPAFPVSIGRVRVDRGTLEFADFSLRPQFGSRIHELAGSVSGLSSDPTSRARVQLEGRVDEYGLSRIEGRIRPLAPVAFTDITMIFRNVEMTNLTPYSGKFAGRKIDSGKLSLDLKYRIEDGKLAADNQIIVERLVLGERVESPDAVNLPLDLAIALLQDSDGRIDIGLPVSGDLNDPQFSYGSLIWKAFVNVITKIVSAPFRALGALLGVGGENLDVVGFEPGRDRLLPPQREQLKRVADALRQRPQLKLSVSGQYSPKLDSEALKSLALRRELATRLGTRPAAGEDPGPPAYDNARTQRTMDLLLEERTSAKGAAEFKARYEKSAGREAKKVNPMLALIGQASPDKAFYEAMATHLAQLQPLPEGLLEQLARRRGEAVLKELQEAAGIDPSRLGSGLPAAFEGEGTTVPVQLTLGVIKPAEPAS